MRGLPFCFAYLIDILTFSYKPQRHACLLRQLFTRLTAGSLVANAAKWEFGANELNFIGHHADANEINPFPDEVAVIRSFPRQQTATKR